MSSFDARMGTAQAVCEARFSAADHGAFALAPPSGLEPAWFDERLREAGGAVNVVGRAVGHDDAHAVALEHFDGGAGALAVVTSQVARHARRSRLFFGTQASGFERPAFGPRWPAWSEAGPGWECG